MADTFDKQVVYDCLNHLTGGSNLPQELQTRLKGVQLAQKLAATRKGQYKIRELLKNYQAPLRNKQEFETEMGSWRAQLMDEENDKKVLRLIFKEVTGSEINAPPELRKKTVLETKKVVDTMHGVVWGINPFTNTKEKLEYQDKETWADFKEKSIESVNVGGKQIVITSLTVEKMVGQAEEAGLSLQSLGRLARCFVEAALPAVAAKVNNIHNDDVSAIFSVIEAAIDVEEEIRIVEKSVDEVKRAPGKFDLVDVVNMYTKMQYILTQLRTGFPINNDELREKIQASADKLGVQALYSLVSNEIRMYLLDDVQTRYSMAGQDLTLERMLFEASQMEKTKPEWRIKTTMRPPTKVYATIQSSAGGGEEADPAASVNAVDGDQDQEEEIEEGFLEENDEDYEDQQFVDDEGEVFYLSKVRRIHMRPSKRDGKNFRGSPSMGRRQMSQSPYRGRVTLIKKYERSSQPPGAKSGSPGRPGGPGSPGKGRGDGAARGKPVWRKFGGRGRGNDRPVTGRTPSRSPGRKRCLRCDSENHLGKNCPRYGKFSTSACRKCKSLGFYPQYHNEDVCLRDKLSKWRNPNSRSSSPATQQRFGFRPQRGMSPIAAKN